MKTARDRFFEVDSCGVKICGITNPGDAAYTVAAGADAVGVNLYEKSKRYVRLEDAMPWLKDVPITRIAVVVNPSSDLLARIIDCGAFEAIQFHGDEQPDDCSQSPLPWIRAVRVKSAETLEAALAYATPWLLLDAYTAAGYGGTGARVNWTEARTFRDAQPDRKIILAGGLTVQNVAAAVKATHPAAVDVASGVETAASARHKDPALVRAFIDAARDASRCSVSRS